MNVHLNHQLDEFTDLFEHSTGGIRCYRRDVISRHVRRTIAKSADGTMLQRSVLVRLFRHQ